MGDEKYCYPNSNVLKNKFGIMDSEELYAKERRITSLTAMRAIKTPVKGNFDLKHLQAIHKAIFSEIYDWAGKIRTVDIAKSNLFCRVQFLDSYSKDIFGRLKEDRFLIGLDRKQAIKKLAEYMGDINALHPFREGNGRTQRQFIAYLAKGTGFEIDFRKIDADRMMDASLRSFQTDYSGFEQIMGEIVTPISLEDQEQFLKAVSKEAYKEFKTLNQKGLLLDREKESENTRNIPGETQHTMGMEHWRSVVSDASIHSSGKQPERNITHGEEKNR